MNGRATEVKLAVVAVAVAATTIALFWPATHNGFLNWDDNLYLGVIPQAPSSLLPALRWAFTSVLPFYYHPITLVSLLLDYRVWGLQPVGFHLTSILLHSINAGLTVLLVWMLIGAARSELDPKLRLAIAGIVGLVFGVHPLQVESVAWIAERKTVLCTLFGLAGLCAHVRSAQGPHETAWRWATVGMIGAALLTKPMAVSFLALLFVIDFYPLRRHLAVGWLGLLKEKAMLVCVTVIVAWLTIVIQSHEGAVKPLEHISIAERCLVAVRSSVFYLWKLVWPAWLSSFYPLGGDLSLRNKDFLVPVILFGAALACVVWYGRKWPALIAGCVAYLALILPVSGILQSGSQGAADRFMYFAMVPPTMLLVTACVLVQRRAAPSVWLFVIGLAAGYVGFLGVRTRQQIEVWRDDESLWRAALVHFPRSSVANAKLGEALIGQNRLDEALIHAELAYRENPNEKTQYILATACGHIAMERAERLQFADAMPFAERAAGLMPDNAQYHAVLGLIYLKQRRPEDSVRELLAALQDNPSLVAARYNLACAYSRLGKFDRSCDTLRVLLTREPGAAQLAVRDPELTGLRDDPEYGEQFRALIRGADSQ